MRYRKRSAQDKGSKQSKTTRPQRRAAKAASRSTSTRLGGKKSAGRKSAAARRIAKPVAPTAAVASLPQGQPFAVQAAGWIRMSTISNGLVAIAATVTVLLALLVTLFWDRVEPNLGPARDGSGNIIHEIRPEQISLSFPEDGFDFDPALIDALIKPAAADRRSAADRAGVEAIVRYPNGDAVPTDPVFFAPPEPTTRTDGAGREAFARLEPAAEAASRTQSSARPERRGDLVEAATAERAEASEPEAVQRPPRRSSPRRYDRHSALREIGGAASVAGVAGAAGFAGHALIAEARRYLGTNPTNRSTLWCGAFLDMVLRRTGHRGGGNLALGYAKYGKRISGPQVGAIVVLTRKGGGHVGIVTGVDANGNPIVISGNHNKRVAEATYPRSRVVAYVVP